MGDAEVEEVEGTPMTVGERLRQAREASGVTLEEIATTTRIPTRHLESLEAGDFARLPAPTYTIGFAKNFAAAVGLDRTEIGDQLRAEIGGSRPVMTTPEVFEPADPARAMPIWLIAAAIGALLLAALLFNWLSNRSLEAPEEEAAVNLAESPPPPLATPAPLAQRAVLLAATDTVWIEVKDGSAILMQGELAAGQSFTVPAGAVAPTLTTAKPEALRITVGTTLAPAIGEAGNKVTASLKPDDLLRQPAPPAVATQPPVSVPETTRARPTASRAEPPAPAPAPTQQANAAQPAATPQQ